MNSASDHIVPSITTSTWDDTITAWAVWLHAADRTPGTVQLRTYHLRRFARFAAPNTPRTITPDTISAFLAQHRWAAATRRSYRASIALYYRWSVLTGRATVDPTALLLVARRPLPLPRPTPDTVVLQALMAAPPRVRLMLLLASEAGLRRAEISQLRASDIDTSHLHVTGKGRRDRIIPLTQRLRRELSWHLEDHGSPWIFPSPHRTGPLGAIRIGELVSAALPEPWTCHSLRHRFATRTYRDSHDLLLVQQLLGHAKPETTAAYVALDSTRAAVIVEHASLTAAE